MTLRSVAIAATLIGALAACSSAPVETVEGSRATLYDSLEALSADSAVIVVGTVLAQTQSGGTVSEIRVLQSSSDDVDSLRVFQYGSDVVSASAPLLEQGETYVLFLNPTTHGAEPNYYMVTGVSAGIYQRTSTGYAWLGLDEDRLPAQLTEPDLESLFAP